MKQKLCALLAGLMIIAALSGCTGNTNAPATSAPDATPTEQVTTPDTTDANASGNADEAPANKVDGGTFIMPITADVSNLNISLTSSITDIQCLQPLYDCLWHSTMAAGTNYYLAESCDISDDGLTYTVKLVENAKWHDGEPITVDDLIYTINMSLETGKNSRAVELDDVPVTYERIDDYTLAITICRPDSAYFTNLGRLFIQPEHVFGGKLDILGAEENMLGIGSGPFKLVEWNKGESLVYERNTDYYRGTPSLEKVIVRIIPDSAVQEIAFDNGELSMFTPSTAQQVEKYLNAEGVTTVEYYDGNNTSIWLNSMSDNPVMNDIDARRAIALALNIPEIVAGALGSDHLGTAAVGIFTPVTMYYDDTVKNWEQDLDTAKKLADKTGLTGQTLRYIYNSDRFFVKNIALIVQQQLKEIGVNVEIVGLDTAAYNSRKKGVEWDLLTQNTDQLNSDPGTKQTMFSGKTKSVNKGELTNMLWDLACGAIDLTEREAYFEAIQHLQMYDLGYIGIFCSKTFIVAKDEFAGLDAKPTTVMFQDWTDIYKVAK